MTKKEKIEYLTNASKMHESVLTSHAAAIDALEATVFELGQAIDSILLEQDIEPETFFENCTNAEFDRLSDIVLARCVNKIYARRTEDETIKFLCDKYHINWNLTNIKKVQNFLSALGGD